MLTNKIVNKYIFFGFQTGIILYANGVNLYHNASVVCQDFRSSVVATHFALTEDLVGS